MTIMTMRMQTIGLGLVSLLIAGAAHAAATPEQKCQAGKNQEAGKFAACLTKAQAKLIQSGDAVKYDASVLKCQAKLDAKYLKLEAAAVKKGALCPTEADSGDLDSLTSAYADSVDVSLGGTRYVDNGDGTISDRAMGLMWEKKSDDGSIHDKDNSYTWGSTSPPYPPTGTAFATFLATLNGGAGADTCFAGHCDWRLPTVEELEGLLDLSESAPKIDPIFKTPCVGGPTVTTGSCTASFNYWSSTTYRDGPGFAWFVNFLLGGVGAGNKGGSYRVRAVRGGS